MTQKQFKKLNVGDLIFTDKKESSILSNVGVVTMVTEYYIEGRTVYGGFARHICDAKRIKKPTLEEREVVFNKIKAIAFAIKELNKTDDVLNWTRHRSEYTRLKGIDPEGAYYAGFYDALLVMTDGLSVNGAGLENLVKAIYDKIPQKLKSK